MRKSLGNGLHIVEERTFGEVDAHDLWELIDDDHDSDTGLEADQHRFRDEIRDKSKAQHGSQDEDAADHQRE